MANKEMAAKAVVHQIRAYTMRKRKSHSSVFRYVFKPYGTKTLTVKTTKHKKVLVFIIVINTLFLGIVIFGNHK